MIKRQIAAWVLALVFLPALLVSSLHVHADSLDSDYFCQECVHHQCGGHLANLSVHQHSCVLCQFLTLPAVFSTAVALATIGYTVLRQRISMVGNAFRFQGSVLSLRAPPISR